MTTLDESQPAPESRGMGSRGLALLGLGWLALGCVPRVSASIVVTEPDDPKTDDPEAEDKGDKPKRAPNDRVPPQILRAEMVSEGLLRIHFSEPLGALDGFDPNDFRISILNVYEGYDYGYAYNYPYNYPGGYAYPSPAPGSNDWASYSDFGYSYYGDPLRFADWQMHGTELTLMFTPPLGPDACRMSSYGNYGPHYVSGLFLHYAAGSIPIRDQQGYPLSNIGADWVLRGRRGPPGDDLQIEGSGVEHAGDELIPIDCSPQLPPGPR